MPKIFDCFIFNDEIDLLKIRLAYLNEFVDYFVIVESCQTFQGQRKKLNFKNNISLFSKYKKNIIYFENNIFAKNINDLKKKIKLNFPEVYKKIELLNNFNKSDFTWYLDAAHREIIKEAVKGIIKKNDLMILSDVDEFPSYKILKYNKFNKNKINVLVQNEFKYFMNSYVSNSWHGTVIGKWQCINEIGLNNLRINAKKSFNKYHYIKNGGYHFTTQGPIKKILKKINSWGHKEFNNFLIKLFLHKRIEKGLDIFFNLKHQFKIVDLNNQNFFDDKISLIIPKSKMKIKKEQYKKKILLDDIFFYILKMLVIFFKLKRKIFK
jgi:beta-1,4-mannosyl-glycoprotein beta-1,4-N-acetylglucosaminyltransferase